MILHDVKLFINAQHTCEGIVEIYLCLMFLKFQKHKCFPKITIGCKGTKITTHSQEPMNHLPLLN